MFYHSDYLPSGRHLIDLYYPLIPDLLITLHPHSFLLEILILPLEMKAH